MFECATRCVIVDSTSRNRLVAGAVAEVRQVGGDVGPDALAAMRSGHDHAEVDCIVPVDDPSEDSAASKVAVRQLVEEESSISGVPLDLGPILEETVVHREDVLCIGW